jgi:hypothetical protein
MNMNFKLGKVSIPVGETKVEIEGIEFGVSDYNLMEGLRVAREIPGILFELRQVMEVDLDEVAPSAGKVEEAEDSSDDVPFGLDALINHLKSQGKKVEFMNHPIFGPGLSVEKGADELDKVVKDIMAGKTEQGKSLVDMLKDIANIKKENTLEDITKAAEIFKSKGGLFGKSI